MARRKNPALDAPPVGLAARVEADVRASGAIALRRLAKGAGLSRRGEALLHEQLAKLGLERTGTVVRVPLARQLDAALAGGELTSVTRLRTKVKGASAEELRRAVARYVGAGRAHLVVREGRPYLAPPDAAVLAREELTALAAGAASLAAALRTTRARGAAPPRTILRADMAEALAHLTASVKPQVPAPSEARGALAHALARLAPTGDELVSVPRLMRALMPTISPEAIREALLDAHRAGAIELRPHSSLDPLPAADEALCPRGFGGAPLSYARRIDAPTGAR